MPANTVSSKIFPVIVLVLLIVRVLVDKYPGWFFLVMIAALAMFLFAFIKIISKKTSRESRRRYGYSIVILIIVMGALYAKARYDWVPAWFGIKLNANTFVSCPQNGVTFEGKNILSVCSTNDKYWRYNVMEAVIYDSSGQIMKKEGSQTDGWKRAAESLDKKAPFGIIGFTAKHIAGDFYSVTFDDYKQQRLINQ